MVSKTQKAGNRHLEQIGELIRQEVEYTENNIIALELKIHTMLQEPTAELGKITRKNTELGEMTAYLKGLKFAHACLEI
jgi:hypothetical protein